jgi:aldose 1-epimerase
VSDLPGVQLYTGNFIDGTETGKDGIVLNQHYGLCLETQFYPDTPNQPNFPQCTFKAGEKFKSTTIFIFAKSIIFTSIVKVNSTRNTCSVEFTFSKPGGGF